MKVKMSQLRNLIKESVQEQIVELAQSQKQLSTYAKICVRKTPFLYEHKNIKSKANLMEFFGPFKKLGVKDLEKMGQEKETKTKEKTQKKDISTMLQMSKEVESARKQLASTKITDVNSIDKALEQYVDKLYDLYQLQQVADLDPTTKAQISKPFAVAAFTLQNLSQSLSDAANKLFQAVPKESGLYSAGREASEIEKATQAFMSGPGGRLKQMGKDVWAGLSGPGGGRLSTKI